MHATIAVQHTDIAFLVGPHLSSSMVPHHTQ